MSGNSAKVRKRLKVGERSGNVCIQGNWVVAAQQNNLPVLYSYCNSFFVCDVYGDVGLNKCAFVRHTACNFVWKS